MAGASDSLPAGVGAPTRKEAGEGGSECGGGSRIGRAPAQEKEPWTKKRQELALGAAGDGSSSQFASWPDGERAVPLDFIACAVFAAIQERDATYCDGAEIANAGGVSITFKGKRLTQVHADVWEGIMHLARGCREGTRLRFRSRQFLRLIGRHAGKSQRDQLHGWITDLVATNIEVRDREQRRRYFGSLLPEGARDESAGSDGAYVVEINRHLCQLFYAGHVKVNWEERQRLRGKWLALWLQHYFARFRRPVDVVVLHRLSGSGAPLKHFRRNLAIALWELEAAGGHAACIDRSSDRVIARNVARALATTGGFVPGVSLPVVLPDKPAQVQVAPSSAAPVSCIPRISGNAMAQFAARYPEYDSEACRADFCAWLAATSRSARRPDAAFMGFAKKWVAGREVQARVAS